MRVKIIRAYGPYSVGHIIEDMQENQARFLIGRNLVAQADLAAPADKMMRAAPSPRRVTK